MHIHACFLWIAAGLVYFTGVQSLLPIWLFVAKPCQSTSLPLVLPLSCASLSGAVLVAPAQQHAPERARLFTLSCARSHLAFVMALQPGLELRLPLRVPLWDGPQPGLAKLPQRADAAPCAHNHGRRQHRPRGCRRAWPAPCARQSCAQQRGMDAGGMPLTSCMAMLLPHVHRPCAGAANAAQQGQIVRRT